MGLFSRTETAIKSKLNSFLNRIEDPRETLDYSYEKQRELLSEVKRGIVKVSTSKKALGLQRQKLQMDIDKLSEQAKTSIAVSREDLARLALEKKAVLVQQAESIDNELKELELQEQKLIESEKKMETQISIFGTRKEALKAEYSAAEASVKINESITGISEEMADLGSAMERAESKTEEMKARASAIDELIEAGTLEDLTGAKKDELERELAKISNQKAVDDELEKLKTENQRPV